MSNPGHDFHYSHLLPRKPGVMPLDVERTVTCGCGATFVTRSRSRERCDDCRAAHEAKRQKKHNERLRARRKAERQQ